MPRPAGSKGRPRGHAQACTYTMYVHTGKLEQQRHAQIIYIYPEGQTHEDTQTPSKAYTDHRKPQTGSEQHMPSQRDV